MMSSTCSSAYPADIGSSFGWVLCVCCNKHVHFHNLYHGGEETSTQKSTATLRVAGDTQGKMKQKKMEKMTTLKAASGKLNRESRSRKFDAQWVK